MIRFFKKIFSIFIIIINLFILIGCDFPNDMSNEDYEIHIIDNQNKKIAIGNIKYKPENGVAFIPYTINGYSVSSLGIPGTLSMTPDLNNLYISRIYLPSTIEQIGNQYMGTNGYTIYKFFFCNNAISLSSLCIDSTERVYIYVPSEYFEEYIYITWNKNLNIYKANVYYYLNIEDDDYYYIDYYEENSIIEFIPPNPKRDGYIFDGWYKEKECINKWNFEIDIVKFDVNVNEIKLYVKWIDE